MKRRIILLICSALLLSTVCVFGTSVTFADDEGASMKLSAVSNSSDKLAISVAYLYREAGDLVLTLPYASINLTQVALMKVYSGERSEALVYLNTRADRQLQAAYDMMDEIIEKYDAVLSKYGVSSGSSYGTKRTELRNMLSSLKTASTELIRRTRALINGTDSGYDSYYTAYCEQLAVLSEKLESYTTTIQGEYDAIMNELLGSDFAVLS